MARQTLSVKGLYLIKVSFALVPSPATASDIPNPVQTAASGSWQTLPLNVSKTGLGGAVKAPGGGFGMVIPPPSGAQKHSAPAVQRKDVPAFSKRISVLFVPVRSIRVTAL